MSNLLSDHQESQHYTYSRSWDDMETMLAKAEKVRNKKYISNDLLITKLMVRKGKPSSVQEI